MGKKRGAGRGRRPGLTARRRALHREDSLSSAEYAQGGGEGGEPSLEKRSGLTAHDSTDLLKSWKKQRRSTGKSLLRAEGVGVDRRRKKKRRGKMSRTRGILRETLLSEGLSDPTQKKKGVQRFSRFLPRPSFDKEIVGSSREVKRCLSKSPTPD